MVLVGLGGGSWAEGVDADAAYAAVDAFVRVEATFDLVAAAVGDTVEGRWPTAGAAASLPVGDLVVRVLG
ncbi:hypothetical protein [Dactylosporangium sp. NPDC050588]|uniref:hypothetical protein n=1 Tax=Dactylosporangium sp. NPDC050588 TaxID=3157211 RepID=UPI0034034791